MIYIPAFLAAICLMKESHFFKEKRRINLYYILLLASALVLVLLLGLRDGVGTDYYDVYVVEFNQFVSTGHTRFEPSFVALMKLVQLMGGDHRLLLFICAAVTVTFVYLAIERYCQNQALALFVACFGGFLLFATNGVRQAIAVSILLYSAVYLKKREVVRYILLVLLATSFHAYSAFFLVCALLTNINQVDIRVMSAFVLVAFLLSNVLSSILIEVAGALSPQIARYLNYENLRNQYLVGDFDFSDFLYCLLPLLLDYVVQFFSQGEGESSSDRALTVNMQVSPHHFFLYIGLIACSLTGGIALLSRFAAYCSPFAILSLGSISIQKVRTNRVCAIALIIYITAIIIMFFYLFIYRNFSNVLPYNTWII